LLKYFVKEHVVILNVLNAYKSYLPKIMIQNHHIKYLNYKFETN